MISALSNQTTIKREVTCFGVGLHSGREVNMALKPAPVDSGIVFVRTDLDGHPTIRALADNVTATVRSTTLEENGVKVFTVEHLLSALHVQEIDNCFVELDAEEPPVMHGSAIDFFNLIKLGGRLEQSSARSETVIDRIYRVDDQTSNGRRFIIALPYDGFRVSFTSVNPHPLIGIQYFDVDIDRETYAREIASARTIAYEQEIEMLRKMGLGLGGSLENVIVYNDGGWINELLYPDELVRHKILDVIGDLRLTGIFKGHIIAAASGHALNTKLAKMIGNKNDQQ